MELSQIRNQFLESHWKEEILSRLPINNLNKGVQLYLYFKDRLSIRLNPDDKIIRLMIYNSGDDRCLEINYNNNLSEIIKNLINAQDEINVDTYLNFYLTLQGICDVSILAYEQFL